MTLDDIYPELDEILGETTDEAIARLQKSHMVSLSYFRELKQLKGWKPLTLEEYAFELKASQQEKVNKALDEARSITNKRVLREYRLHPKKPKKD